MQEQWPSLKAEHPSLEFIDLQRLVAKAWAQLSVEQKAPYQSRADTERTSGTTGGDGGAPAFTLSHVCTDTPNTWEYTLYSMA